MVDVVLVEGLGVLELGACFPGFVRTRAADGPLPLEAVPLFWMLCRTVEDVPRRRELGSLAGEVTSRGLEGPRSTEGGPLAVGRREGVRR